MANIDFLVKSELEYENLVRGADAANLTVYDLRKQLRSLNKMKISPNAHNLLNKIVVEEELNLIELNVSQLEDKTKECILSLRAVDIVRLRCKINHYMLRSQVVNKFKLSEGQVKTVKEFISKCKTMLSDLDLINTNDEIRDLTHKIEEKINSSFEEEEALNSEIEHKLKIDTPEPTAVHTPTPNFSMYSKLPNPAERFLKQLKQCNGLKVLELLDFLKILLKMKSETKFEDSELLEIILGHVSEPLYSKIVECKDVGKTIEETQLTLLNTFVPLNVRENLKHDFVTRPQRVNEAFSCYVISVKEHAKVLACQYSESDLVKLIVIGLNRETRSRLTLVEPPKNFNDLDNLCIHEQNVAYTENYLNSYNGRDKTNVNSVKCYSCGRLGHVQKHCRRANNSASRPNNKFNQSATVPKNL